ncbi:MAG: hypothetical protein WAO55_01815 [Candidatus Manganitrophaceae bacterium]
MKKRNENPSRFRKFREDASIATAEKTLERLAGLPQGSIKLVFPSGRKARTDSTVGVLIEKWEAS